MDRHYGQDLEQIYQDHNSLIGNILQKEEELIDQHKTHVNEIINCEKEEMALITEVDKSGSDVEQYVDKLDKLLLTKM